MLRVTTLYASTAASTAQYYTRYLTRADGELPGRWAGHQADLLGLHGEVTTDALELLLEGRDPTMGTPLGNPLVDRTTKTGKVIRAVAGFDATFSAPKSLSVWWALTGNDNLAQCHDTAVAAVVDHLERSGSTTRVRSNGHRLHPDTGGLSCAVFRQTTSRLDDPQLHSHVVISSKVQTADGRWLALDAKTLKGFQRALGGIYQSVLRAEVTARFGVAWGDIDKGQAEIVGVPAELLDVFSKRAAQVDAAVQTELAEFWVREGRDPTPKERGAIGRQAAQDTRGHKTGTAATDLRSLWTREAAAVGVTADSLQAGMRAAARAQPAEPDRVTVDDVIGELAERRSAWHRLDVTQTLCDTIRPQRGINGARWAAALERATDTVLERCVDLDPTDTHTRHRHSDGRSVWIEPSARHHTSDHILAQEEHIITWAIDNQLEPSTASTTITGVGLDVMQTEAAAAIAGHDRLVLVVGPAGAGKTTMLHTAATDLGAQGRRVFGLAPTAKAARVLETSTGIKSDTAAKLIYEWTQPNRPPQPAWQLDPGTTVLVDEAGMLATGDLHQLTQLADRHAWRLALIGDPHQLSAVGRGGMFNELCATGRPIELETIHRFHNGWEAAASLELRHGNPTGLNAYIAHNRISAAPFHEHVNTIAHAWADRHRRGEQVAVTTTTNDHVNTINQAVQAHRLAIGQVSPRHLDAGDNRFHVGDVITTRNNQRLLRTTTGDSVRNRDYWTINTITDDGDLSVTRIDGHGTVTLPAQYVAEHVQLGYAATEPGNQSDTATASITLATTATTCRGLYVSVTRGRQENLICVATDTHNLDDAIDVLEHILASDRTDMPATRTRRELAATTPPAPTPTLRPRCSIPNWFHDLQQDRHRECTDARAAVDAHQREQDRLEERIAQITEQLDELAPVCAPHDRAIADVKADVEAAGVRHRQAERDLTNSGRLRRRGARQHVAATASDVTTGQVALDELTRRAQPLLVQRASLHDEQRRLRDRANTKQTLHDFRRDDTRLVHAERDIRALDTWHQWATGHHLPASMLIDTSRQLRYRGGEQALLAEPLITWIHDHGIAPPQPTPAPPQRRVVHRPVVHEPPRPEPPGLEIGF